MMKVLLLFPLLVFDLFMGRPVRRWLPTPGIQAGWSEWSVTMALILIAGCAARVWLGDASALWMTLPAAVGVIVAAMLSRPLWRESLSETLNTPPLRLLLLLVTGAAVAVIYPLALAAGVAPLAAQISMLLAIIIGMGRALDDPELGRSDYPRLPHD
jgi:hypothetical protein